MSAALIQADQLNAITEPTIGAAMEVDRALGPGLLESANEACLVFELRERGLRVEQQKPLPITYKGVKLDCGYRLDLVVADCVIVEIKSCREIEFGARSPIALLLEARRLPSRVAPRLPLHNAKTRDSQTSE